MDSLDKKSNEASAATDRPHSEGLFQGVARHSFIYAFGMIVGRVVSFLMLPIYTRFLTPADYGVLALIELTLDFITIIAGAKLVLGVFRYYHKAETQKEREEVVSTSFLLVAGLYSVVGMAAFLASEPLSHLVFGSGQNTILFQIASVNVALGALLMVPLSLARVEDRSVFFVGMNLVKLVLQVVAVLIFLVVMDLGVLGVFLATLLANLLVGVAATVWLYRRVRLSWTGRAAQNLFRYGFPLMLTKVATFATTFSDRYFLQAVADETAVGLYNLTYQFGFILVMVGFAPIDQIWSPKRFEVAARTDADDVLSRGFILINVVLISVAVAISLFVYDLLRVMATPPFWSAAELVPLILIAYVLQSWASVQDIGILLAERTRYVAVANFVAAGVAVVGYLIFVPRYLQWGAASVTVVAFAVQFGLIYWFSQRLRRIRYRWRPVLLLCGWAAVAVGVSLLLPELPIFQSILARSALGLIFLAGVWVMPILERRDKEALLGLLDSVKRMLLTPRQPKR